MKTARVILTLDCNRDCKFCANKISSEIENAIVTDDVRNLEDYEAVVITGGEPMLYQNALLDFTYEIRDRFPDTKIFLYTALYTPSMPRILEGLDGITFTIHHLMSISDLNGFYDLQDLIVDDCFDLSWKNFRLLIEESISTPINIIPSRWDSIRTFAMSTVSTDCKIPDNETLFNFTGYIRCG